MRHALLIRGSIRVIEYRRRASASFAVYSDGVRVHTRRRQQARPGFLWPVPPVRLLSITRGGNTVGVNGSPVNSKLFSSAVKPTRRNNSGGSFPTRERTIGSAINSRNPVNRSRRRFRGFCSRRRSELEPLGCNQRIDL